MQLEFVRIKKNIGLSQLEDKKGFIIDTVDTPYSVDGVGYKIVLLEGDMTEPYVFSSNDFDRVKNRSALENNYFVGYEIEIRKDCGLDDIEGKVGKIVKIINNKTKKPQFFTGKEVADNCTFEVDIDGEIVSLFLEEFNFVETDVAA